MEQYTLDNGLTVVTERLDSCRSVSIGVWLRVGSVNETPENNGISHVLEHLLFKGTETRDARQLMELVERVGGGSNAFTDREHTCLYAKVLDTHLPLALDLIGDTLLHSTYPDFEQEKRVIEEEIQSYYETPEEHVHDVFAEALWAGHPLGMSITGSREAVQRIALDDVRQYAEHWHTPDNAVLAVAGNFDDGQLRDLVERHLGGWSGKTEPAPYAGPSSAAATVADRRDDLQQTQLVMGMLGIPVADPRRYAFSILANVLGGSCISRLFQRVREQEGLAYHVSSFISTLEHSGVIGVTSAQGAEHTDRVVDISIEEMVDLKRNPLSDDELATYKEQLKGNIMLGLESNTNRMMRLGRSMLSLGYVDDMDTILNNVEAVTAEGVQALAEELFQPDRMTYTVLGPTGPLAPRDF